MGSLQSMSPRLSLSLFDAVESKRKKGSVADEVLVCGGEGGPSMPQKKFILVTFFFFSFFPPKGGTGLFQRISQKRQHWFAFALFGCCFFHDGKSKFHSENNNNNFRLFTPLMLSTRRQ
jgi:hypothetical protein